MNKIRNTKLSDLPTIGAWWKHWEGENYREIDIEELPNGGTGGVVIERDGVMLAAAFLYVTNSKLGYLSYLVRNPDLEYSEEEQEMFVRECLLTLKKWGCNRMFAITKIPSVIKKLKQYEFVVTPQEYSVAYCKLRE